jgi:hypothetical protein
VKRILPVDHFLIMTTYAFFVAAFFALLWRQGRRDRLKLFAIIFGSLVFGGLALAWLMFPFPK